MERMGYLRVQVMTAKEGQQEMPAMTSITVSIPAGVSANVARIHALEVITSELERYGVAEALGPLFPSR